MPRLTSSGLDRRQICRQFGLAASGVDGDRSPITEGGVVDLSPIRRLGLTDHQILADLYETLSEMKMMISAPTVPAEGRADQ